MDKYLCVCGMGFKKAQQAHDHVKAYIDSESAWPHQVMKRKWKGRFIDFMLRLPINKIFRFIGALFIYFTVVKHFKIEWTMLEATLIGIGLGLVID